MLRDLLSHRAIQVGLVFFLIVASSSLLYSWYVQRTTETELERSNRFLSDTEQQKAIRPAEQMIAPTETETPGLVDTPDENSDTQMPDTTEALPNETEGFDVADAFLPDESGSEEAPTEEVPVSPFGYGPYPEVPSGFPDNLQPIWTMSEEQKRELVGRLKDFELMSRVLIKLWNQGDQDFIGVLRRDNDGKVYPTYPNTMYVSEWDKMETKHGVIRVPSAAFGSARMPPIYPYVREHGRLPEGIKFIDYENKGYAPEEFLGLQ